MIEDAAQGMMASYKGKALGTLSDFGCYSFHETKNYSMGEGGALLINKKEFVKRAEIIREKGTNRCEFHRGEVDKYTWVDLGSSYLPSELNAAYLYAQLLEAQKILSNRLNCFQFYNEHLEILECRGLIQRPHIPAECEHNAHMFYIKVDSIETRTALLSHLTKNGILAVFHYVPLHVSPVGKSTDAFMAKINIPPVKAIVFYACPLLRVTRKRSRICCSKVERVFKKIMLFLDHLTYIRFIIQELYLHTVNSNVFFTRREPCRNPAY